MESTIMNYSQDIVNILKILSVITKKHTERLIDVSNCFSENQLKCKTWLVEKVNNYPYHFKNKTKESIDIAIFGGWYGLTAQLMFDRFKIKPVRKIYSYDFDPFAKKFGNMFFPHIEFFEKDIKDLKIEEKSFSIIVNTSCEHMEQKTINDTIDSAPQETLFVLQSNNYIEIDQHINCSASLTDFADRYDGRLKNLQIHELDMGKYTRFMVIGSKK